MSTSSLPSFHQNPSSRSGEEVESVKVYDGRRRRTDDGRCAMTIAHLSLRLRLAKNPFLHDHILHNNTLESVSSAKYLGITLQSDLKWNIHIDNIASNANKLLGFLKRNLKVSNTNIKSKAWQALVRPKLEYSCSVWDPHQSHHTHKLEMVQRRAAGLCATITTIPVVSLTWSTPFSGLHYPSAVSNPDLS